MKLKIITIVAFLVHGELAFPQQGRSDSLLAVINKQAQDKGEVNALAHIANDLHDFDSAFNYAERGLRLAQKINDAKGRADCLLVLAAITGNQSNNSASIKYALNAQSIYEEIGDSLGVASAHGILQATFRATNDLKSALTHALKAVEISKNNPGVSEFTIPGHSLVVPMEAEVAQTYLLMGQLDSAIYFTRKAIDAKEPFNNSEWNFPVYLLATIQTIQGNYKDALGNFQRAIPLASSNLYFRDTLQIFSGMSTLFKKTGQLDSAIYYAHKVAASRDPDMETKNLLEAVANLGEIYKMRGDKDSALKYIELNDRIKDSLFSNEKNREIQNITFTEKLREQEMAASQIRYRSKVQLYSLVAGIAILIIITVLLWRNSRNKQRAKEKIERAYADLRDTQGQLVQREKMASLGELTAGIAHEIQNPLNFVNNFSDVNTELIDEAEQEMENGNIEEVKSILSDVKDNEQKINHHGKRADAIVKGMLQHSRVGSGQKELTDINNLADEYLRLAYYGLRAKDKTFNADVKTDFDKSIGKISVVPQDIGRVILNLINNAFYAAHERAKLGATSYEPRVIVTTKRLKDHIEIIVKDNGNGIPQKIVDKIFQPFFTTKPTGQGTGLGLSLAYDIVKAHGGEIKVVTSTDEGLSAGASAKAGSEFVIQLPVS
jgi:signal transduction histidine kinase